MKAPVAVFLSLVLPICATADLPTDEAGAIAFFKDRGDRLTLDTEGHPTKLFSGGKPELTILELQLIGKLTHLQELAINASPGADGDWAFLHDLPNLKKLTIWHGHHFSSLAPFASLPVESILFGGCMGLRNLNKDDPAKLRDPVLTLRDLPNLKSLTLYHSPLTPDDSHLAHIVEEFPNLTELRVDFAAPRAQEINITPSGLAELARLKLTRFAIENSESLTPAHFTALAKIESLKTLFIYPPRKGEFDHAPLMADLKKLRPDLKIEFFKKPG